jgi:protein pelota
VQLVEDVKRFGAEVAIFSSMHESGERKLATQQSFAGCQLKCLCPELNQLTGIAAILTYPMDIEDVLEEERILAEQS